jgi:hypothetical protein
VGDSEIDFTAPATLRKWPSLNKERVPKAWGGIPYLVADGTLDDCIREFMSRPQPHLYQIHTRSQPPLGAEILEAEQIIELARLRDFL